MLKFLDDALDHVTMYRLTLYYLLMLLALSFPLAFFGLLSVDPAELALSAILVLAVTLLTSALFALVFRTPVNSDSILITALILILILQPAAISQPLELGAIVFAAIWAMGSKYIFAYGKKHLFNPAALGALAAGLALNQPGSWWAAGNLPLLPFIVIGGLLVVRKLQRGDLILAFVLATLATQYLADGAGDFVNGVSQALLYSPLAFLAFAMLSEPLTTPPRRWGRISYGALIGCLATPSIHLGSFYLTPELAVILGNLFAFLVSPKGRLELTLVKIERAAANAYDFVFSPDRKLAFLPGQYLEFSLRLRQGDNRGNRRYFTLASAPTEETLRLGVKFNPEGSAFKRTMAMLRPGDKMFASQLAGDFTLPADPAKKLVFIAGGIGITPFRSMIQYLLDRGERRRIVLLYGVERAADIAYRDLFERARQKLGIHTAYAVAEEDPPPGAYRGLINAEIIAKEVPDFPARQFYISGPRSMVIAVERVLAGMGVKHSQIKTDFFPGFA